MHFFLLSKHYSAKGSPTTRDGEQQTSETSGGYWRTFIVCHQDSQPAAGILLVWGWNRAEPLLVAEWWVVGGGWWPGSKHCTRRNNWRTRHGWLLCLRTIRIMPDDVSNSSSDANSVKFILCVLKSDSKYLNNSIFVFKWLLESNTFSTHWKRMDTMRLHVIRTQLWAEVLYNCRYVSEDHGENT